MSIIYSYPEQSILNPGDMLIGTSVEKVGGKQKNVTKNFTIQQVADFINRGAGFVDPVATDFQIPVFNQGGLKITGSIMSQDSSPSNGVAGTGITIAGTLTTTGSLTVGGGATIGDQVSNIVFDSPTKLLGPILDSGSVQGGVNQILISNQLGKVNWVNYDAGLTYQGVWNANTNTPALTSGVGTNGHFYVVDVLGNTNLNGNNDWQVGDWALFSGVTGAGGFWDKIDNTQSLTGSGTANTITMWTAGQAIGDSLISQAGTVVSVNGSLNTNGSIGTGVANYDITTSATNQNLRVKGNGTGGLEVRGETTSNTDGKITLNCSQNTHGVTLQSPAHGSTVSYTLILPTSFGGAGDVLTSAGANPSQLVWTTPTTGTVTGTGTTSTLPIWSDGTAGVLGDSIMSYAGTVISVNGDFSTQGLEVNKYLTDGAGNSGTDGQVLTSTTVAADKEIVWTTPTVGTVTNFTTVSTAIPGITTVVADPTTTPTLTLSITGTPGAGLFLNGTGNWSSPGGGVTDITATAPLNADVSTGSVTLSMPAYATATGGYVPIGGASGEYLDGLSGNWTSLPVSGVTSVTGTVNRIAITGTASVPIVNAVTGAVNSSSLTLATGQEIQSAIDLALAGAVTFKGTFNANLGSITGTSDFLYNPGANSNTVPIAIGDMYIVSTAGNFYGVTALNVGDEVIAIAAASINASAEAGWNAVPSAGAGVVSVLPSSTGLVSTGQPLVITPAGGTGTVTIESTAYAGTTNVGHVPAGGSAGKYLDGASGAWTNLPASGTGTVTGTGAATQVTFWDGTSNVNGDTAFNWDNTNKRLGIGTASPGYKLDVNGDARFGNGNNYNPLIQYAGSGRVAASPGYSFVGSLGTGMFIPNTANTLAFSTAATERMRITSGGNVGIGTTSPSAKLDVRGEALVGDGTDGVKLTYSTGNSTGIIDTGYSSTGLEFRTGGTERMRITSTGQVKFNNYTAANSFTGTAVASLAVDSSGNIITEAAGGGASATITTRSTTTANATTTVFALGATPNGGSTSFVDVFVDGVYQEITTYSVTGTTNITFGAALPSGVTVETKTTADYNVGAAVDTVSLGQSNIIGNVDLRINPIEVTSGTTELGVANSLYIFTSTTGSISTLTLPASPTSGDSIKISNIGGLANVIATSGTDKIMGQAGPMTINVTNAAFELIWSNIAAQGWIIIGNV